METLTSALAAGFEQLAALPDARVLREEPLAAHTRFAIGGPASIFFDAASEQALAAGLRITRELGLQYVVIGGGTNLIVADEGFAGVVLRYAGAGWEQHNDVLRLGAGLLLQEVVDGSMRLGLAGLQTMTGIPGDLGGAIYGNAGAYGHSIDELVREVRFLDDGVVSSFSGAQCEFRYRSSIFKSRKEWIIVGADLGFHAGDRADLEKQAREIRAVRDAKYPPEMRCAGSIFKNLLWRELPEAVRAVIPERVVREGKVPSAWFLEQAGAKGMRRGDIQVAEYHANLIYNDGAGTARDVVAVIRELKQRVRERFNFELEEEVQYVGFREL